MDALGGLCMSLHWFVVDDALYLFLCPEYVAEKKRFRTLKPKVLTYVKCRIRQNGGTLDPIDPLDSPARGMSHVQCCVWDDVSMPRAVVAVEPR